MPIKWTREGLEKLCEGGKNLTCKETKGLREMERKVDSVPYLSIGVNNNINKKHVFLYFNKYVQFISHKYARLHLGIEMSKNTIFT